MLPSSSQWYQVRNLIFVHPSFAAAEVLLLRACLEGLISPGSEHCNRVLWRSRRTLRTLAPPALLCSCILPKPEPASSALQCCTVCMCRELKPARAGAKQPRSTGVPATYFLLFGDGMLLLWTQYTCKYLGIFFSNIYVFFCSVKNYNF